MLNNNEEPRFAEFHELPEDLMSVVAEDGKVGCPVTRWDGPYSFRCSLGICKCAVHGQFKVKIKE